MGRYCVLKCTDDNGYIHLNDRRVEEKSLASVQVGDESSPALMGMSSLVPGLLVTVAEENDIVKVWDLDVNKATLDMLAYKKVKLVLVVNTENATLKFIIIFNFLT